MGIYSYESCNGGREWNRFGLGKGLRLEVICVIFGFRLEVRFDFIRFDALIVERFDVFRRAMATIE